MSDCLKLTEEASVSYCSDLVRGGPHHEFADALVC